MNKKGILNKIKKFGNTIKKEIEQSKESQYDRKVKSLDRKIVIAKKQKQLESLEGEKKKFKRSSDFANFGIRR